MSSYLRSNVNCIPIKEGDATIFYVNTSGFPLAQDTVQQMWKFAKELQPNAVDMIEKLERNSQYRDEPIHTPPYNCLTNKNISNQEKIEKIQDYINKLQYNHTGMQFFDIKKDRPLAGLVDVARKIIDEALPIKCLEAVVLSIYLTNEITSLERFTIGFKTTSNQNIHRHVVLGVYCHKTQKFGALGISRRSELAFKPLVYDSLYDLIRNYINSYAIYLHKVKRIRVGMPIPNSNRSYESIKWNGVTVNPSKHSANDWPKQIEKHSRSIRIYNAYSNAFTQINQAYDTDKLKLLKLNTSHELINYSATTTSKVLSTSTNNLKLDDYSKVHKTATLTQNKTEILLTKRRNLSIKV